MKSIFKQILFASLVFIAASASLANASIIYQNGGSDPWGNQENDTAMNTAFGSGNWTKSFGFNLGQFTGASFVYLDGSDANAIALNSFISTNVAAIQNYVNGGGRLLINAAPNQGGAFSLGFGVMLNYWAGSGTATVNAAGVAAGFTAGGITTNYTGNWFSHASVSGGGISNLIDGTSGTIFGAKQYGGGFVAFGGQTTPNWHGPLTDARRLMVNQVLYVSNTQVPEPASLALVGLGLFGLALRRRKQK